MILSASASYEDAVSKYAWLKYTGTRGKEVSQRTHKRMIREGDVFGILPLRNGSRFTLIFPDMPHIDFPLDKKDGAFLMERSSKLRKLPDIVNREGRSKTAGAQTLARKLARTNFDAARFQPKNIPNEAKNGVNFDNYQWRMVPQNDYEIKTTKGLLKLHRNDMIGVRFLRQGKGGIIVNNKGLYVLVKDEEFDRIVGETNIMPIQDWPKGEISPEEILAYRTLTKREKRRSESEEREAIRLAARASRMEGIQQEKELKRAARLQEREKNAELKELRRKVRSGEMEAPTGEVRTVYDDAPKRSKQVRVIEHEELEEDELLADDLDEDQDIDIDLEASLQRLQDVIGRSPFSGDLFGIEETVGSLFGGDDGTHEDVEADFDLSDMDEPEDDEEDTPPAKVRKKGSKPAKPAEEDSTEEDDADSDADSSDGDSEEDDADDADNSEEDPDEDDGDIDEEEDSDDSDSVADDADSDDDSESVDDDTSDDEGDDSEADEGDDEEEDDSDTSDAVDETEDGEDSDSDVAAAEDEANKTAKQIAAANKSTPDKRAAEPEEGDVLRFKADAKLQRDWVILKISTHSSSDNIVVYTLYDLTNSPEEVRNVRINRARKQSLFDYAEHIKDMTPKLFNRVLDMADEFPVNKDPIAS